MDIKPAAPVKPVTRMDPTVDRRARAQRLKLKRVRAPCRLS